MSGSTSMFFSLSFLPHVVRPHYGLSCSNSIIVDFQPMQREYGRLNFKGTIMSKRDIQSLIQNKVVRGWDDPRLYTVSGMRRRGIPPGALLSFVYELGVTTSNSPSKSSVSSRRFDDISKTRRRVSCLCSTLSRSSSREPKSRISMSPTRPRTQNGLPQSKIDEEGLYRTIRLPRGRQSRLLPAFSG